MGIYSRIYDDNTVLFDSCFVSMENASGPNYTKIIQYKTQKKINNIIQVMVIENERMFFDQTYYILLDMIGDELMGIEGIVHHDYSPKEEAVYNYFKSLYREREVSSVGELYKIMAPQVAMLMGYNIII